MEGVSTRNKKETRRRKEGETEARSRTPDQAAGPLGRATIIMFIILLQL